GGGTIRKIDKRRTPVDPVHHPIVEGEGDRPMPGAASDIETALFPRPSQLVKHPPIMLKPDSIPPSGISESIFVLPPILRGWPLQGLPLVIQPIKNAHGELCKYHMLVFGPLGSSRKHADIMGVGARHLDFVSALLRAHRGPSVQRR